MDDNEYKTWVGGLAELTADQQQDVLRRMKFGLGVRPDPKLDEDWLLVGLCASLRRQGIISTASLPGLLKSNGAKAYAGVSAALRDDLEKLLPATGKAAARTALASLVGESLVKYMEFRHIPITGGNVLLNTQHTMNALNKSFPGYIKAGMFHLVLNGALHHEPERC